MFTHTTSMQVNQSFKDCGYFSRLQRCPFGPELQPLMTIPSNAPVYYELASMRSHTSLSGKADGLFADFSTNVLPFECSLANFRGYLTKRFDFCGSQDRLLDRAVRY